jgi:NADH dehydrogenase [ubiquinone] 1 alpha subcomplex assembly factor 4
MGNIVSLIGKAALRPVKNIAVEVRAEKVISRDKPIPAPWHPTTEKRLQEIKQGLYISNIILKMTVILMFLCNFLLTEFPERLSKELNEKDEELLNKLKSVYVTSYDPSPPELKKENPLRPLPKVREYQGVSEMGYTEPDMIPKGKISMRQALLMIGKHHQDPESNTTLTLAQEYTLDLQTTGKDNIIKYFSNLSSKC